jgi:predicted ATPase
MHTHLKGFGLENFRVFKDYTWFDFAPIMILTGPNSSGKSSLNKALMLMKDNFGGRDSLSTSYLLGKPFTTNLNFDSENHKLANFENAKNRYSESEIIKFSVPFATSLAMETVIIFSFSKTDLLQYEILTKDGRSLFRLSKSEMYLDMPFIKNEVLQNHWRKSRLHEEGFPTEELDRLYELTRDFIIENDWKPENRSVSLTEFDDVVMNISSLPVKITKSFWLQNSISIFSDQNVVKAIEYLFSSLSLFNLDTDTIRKFPYIHDGFVSYPTQRIDHLSSIKTAPKHFFSNNDEDIINKLIKTKISLNWLNNPSPFGDNPDIEFYKKWCLSFGLRNIEMYHNAGLNLNTITIDGLSLVDNGFGITPLTILLLHIVLPTFRGFARWGSDSDILLVEEPEANLHPKLQSQLADFFLDACKSLGYQFLLETHSEYLIRKFQFLVAKKEMKSEDIIIYYFHDPNNVPKDEKQVKKIQILEDGSLSDDFGPGFFDEAANWELELIRLKNAKNRNN